MEREQPPAEPVGSGPVPPVERDDVPASTFAPGVDQPAEEVASAGTAAEAEDLLGRS